MSERTDKLRREVANTADNHIADEILQDTPLHFTCSMYSCGANAALHLAVPIIEELEAAIAAKPDQEKRLYELLWELDKKQPGSDSVSRVDIAYDGLGNIIDRNQVRYSFNGGLSGAIAELEKMVAPKTEPKEPTPEEVLAAAQDATCHPSLLDVYALNEHLTKMVALAKSLIAEKRGAFVPLNQTSNDYKIVMNKRGGATITDADGQKLHVSADANSLATHFAMALMEHRKEEKHEREKAVEPEWPKWFEWRGCALDGTDWNQWVRFDADGSCRCYGPDKQQRDASCFIGLLATIQQDRLWRRIPEPEWANGEKVEAAK